MGAPALITFASVLGLFSGQLYGPAPWLPFIPKSVAQLLLGVGGLTTAHNLALPAVQVLLVRACERLQLIRDDIAPMVASINLATFGLAGFFAPLVSGGLYATNAMSIPWIVSIWFLSFLVVRSRSSHEPE